MANKKFLLEIKEGFKVKIKYLFVLCVLLSFYFVSCVSYRPVDVTNTMAAQIIDTKFYNLQPGDHVQTLYIKRKGSFIRDLSAYESSWYFNHQDKIISIEAVRKQIRFLFFKSVKDKWRIEYVD